MDSAGRASAFETVRGVSPLGSWSYCVWRPPQLHGLIDHLWAYDGPSSHRLKRVFPNGRVEILLNFGDAYRLVEGAGAEACRNAWLSGPQVGPIVLEQPAHQRVIGVRLRPAVLVGGDRRRLAAAPTAAGCTRFRHHRSFRNTT